MPTSATTNTTTDAGRRRPRGAAASTRRDDEGPLARAIVTALRRLPTVDHADAPAAHAHRVRIETLLREAIRRQEAVGAPLAAVPAVTVACAHLVAGGVEDAHLALLTARDLL